MQKRLSIWKQRYISKGGRCTLTQSALSNMPICFVFVMYSKESRTEVGVDSKGFSLESRAFKRKPYLVAWSIICSNKHRDSLVLRNSTLLNKALVYK